MKKIIVTGAALAMLAAAPAPAARVADDYFSQCDGEAPPIVMTAEKAQKLNYTGISVVARTSPSGRRLGGVAVGACDSALADPALRATYWLRRAELLQAKAYHLMADRKYLEALAVLNESDATAKVDPMIYFVETVGLGNQVLRGIVLRKLGRTEESERAFATAGSARPYSISIARLIRSARIFSESDKERRVSLLAAGTQLEPGTYRTLFWLAMFGRNYAEAVHIAPQTIFDLPRAHGGWGSYEEVSDRYELIVERTRFEGAGAYALAATGRPDAAKARIAEARAEIAEVATPLTLKTPSRAIRDDYELRMESASRATKDLDGWERAIALRNELKGKSLAEAKPLLPGNMPAFQVVAGDLLRQLVPANALERTELDEMIARADRVVNAVMDEAVSPTLRTIVQMLPIHEFPTRAPRIRRESVLGSGNNGYKVYADPATNRIHVRFGSETATPAMVEEAALLAAANYALSKGKDSFYLTGLRVIRRTTHVRDRWVGSYDVDSGHEVRLVLELADSANPPEVIGNETRRLIPVASVIALLGPKYMPVKRK